MKRLVLALVVLVAMTGILSAQMMTGVGGAVMIDVENYGYEDVFTSIGVDLFYASSSTGFGFFADLVAGYIIGWTEDGVNISATLAFMDTTVALSVLAGAGYAMDMGGMSMYLGAGAHLGMFAISNDYGGIVHMGIGAGVTANVIIPMGGMKLRIGCDAAMDFLPIGDIADLIDITGESYSGLYVVPVVGVIF